MSFQLLGVGDFLQLPPVLYPTQNLAFRARCWDKVFPRIARLTTVQRQVDKGML